MIEISLQDFVRTGRFGPVALGQSRADIAAALGDSDNMSAPTRKRRVPQVWKYGDFEFHFHEHSDALAMIFIDHFNVPRSGKSVAIDPWIIRRDVPFNVLSKALAELGLTRETVRDELLERVVLHASSGIQFAYYPSDLKRPKLDTLEVMQISNWADG